MTLIKNWRRFNRSIKFIWNHPLVKVERLKALFRYFSFHILTRINNVEKSIPFIEGTKVTIRRDLSGIATNYYTYLADFEEMSFLLHFLKPDDVFYDIGSNVGVYTILASGVIGCQTIAIEPVKETYDQLLRNIDLNQIRQAVITYNIALGKDEGIAHISKSKGALNRIRGNKYPDTESVKQKSLDIISCKYKPNLLKIDVEGFEMEVLKGGELTLSNPELQGLIIEINGNSRKYGLSDNQIHHEIISYGFKPVCYDPFNRYLKQLNDYNIDSHNTIYVRNYKMIREIIKKSQKYQLGRYCI